MEDQKEEEEVKISVSLKTLTSWLCLSSVSQVSPIISYKSINTNPSNIITLWAGRQNASKMISDFVCAFGKWHIEPMWYDICLLSCFPDGLQVTNEQKDEQFHFLVFTDVFGNKTHGIVMQCYRPILVLYITLHIRLHTQQQFTSNVFYCYNQISYLQYSQTANRPDNKVFHVQEFRQNWLDLKLNLKWVTVVLLFLCFCRRAPLSSTMELGPLSFPRFSLPSVSVSYQSIHTSLRSKTAFPGERGETKWHTVW